MDIPSTTPPHSRLPAHARSASAPAITLAAGATMAPGLDARRPEVSPYPAPWNGPFRIMDLPPELRRMCLELADTPTLFRMARVNRQLMQESAHERISRFMDGTRDIFVFRAVHSWTECLPAGARIKAVNTLSVHILHPSGSEEQNREAARDEAITLVERTARSLVALDAGFEGAIPSRQVMLHAMHVFRRAGSVWTPDDLRVVLADVAARPGDGSDGLLAPYPALQAELFCRMAPRVLYLLADHQKDVMADVMAAGRPLREWFSPEQHEVFDALPSAHAATVTALEATRAEDIRALLVGGEGQVMGRGEAAPAWRRWPPELQSSVLTAAGRSISMMARQQFLEGAAMLGGLLDVRGRVRGDRLDMNTIDTSFRTTFQMLNCSVADARALAQARKDWIESFRVCW